MDNFSDVYDDLKKILDDDVSMENLTSVVLKIVQLAEKNPISGPEKKILTMSLINKLINDSNIEDKDSFLKIVNSTVPPMIDCLVDIDNRKIIIKKIPEKYRNCADFLCI